MTKIAISIIAMCIIGGILFGLYQSHRAGEATMQCSVAEAVTELPPPDLTSEPAQGTVDNETNDAVLDRYLKMRQNVVVAKRSIPKGKHIAASDVVLKSVNYFPVYPYTRVKEVVGHTIARDNIPQFSILTTELLQQVQ